MPTIVKKGKRWECQIRMAGEQNEYPRFDTEEEAREYGVAKEKRLREERKAAAFKVAPPPPDGDLDKEELRTTLKLYSEKPGVSEYHLKSIPTILRNIGRLTVGQMDDAWVEDFAGLMRAQSPPHRLTPYTFRTIRGFMDAIVKALAWRVRRLRLNRQPFKYDRQLIGIDRYGNRERVLSGPERQRLHSRLRKLRLASGRHWRCLVGLALCTGARLGELLNATWSQFDIEARRWLIPELANKTKTKRLVPLGRRSLKILSVLRADSDPNDPRLLHRLGYTASISCTFWKLAKKAQLDDFNFHDFRHMAIVSFVRRAKTAADLVKIMKAVGHKDYSTFDGYITFHDHEMFTIFD